MDAWGNQEHDVQGNIGRDVFGNPDNSNVFGNQPADGWGNPLSNGFTDGGDGGGLLDSLFDILGGLFG